jgi:hypothetical protein
MGDRRLKKGDDMAATAARVRSEGGSSWGSDHGAIINGLIDAEPV